MYKFTRDSIVDIDLFETRLRHNGFIVYDYEKMQLEESYMKTKSATYAGLAKDTMMHRSGSNYFMLSPEAVYSYLTRTEHCPEHYFSNKKSKSGKPSLDMNRVLSKLYANGHARPFLEDYMQYRSLAAKCSKIESLLKTCKGDGGKNKFGVDLHKIYFSVGRQKNLRFNYKNPDIISQISREYLETVSVEDGYFLAWGDFEQSDFRIAYNLFLRSHENDLIMNKYEDKYEALARIVSNTMGQTFDLDKFKQERDLYKRLTLATMYGTRNSVIAEEQGFIKNFSAFLEKCPKYKTYYERLEQRYQLGLPLVVTSYFGNEQSIPIVTYDKSATVNDGLNSPIQTGTSEIMILTVNAILDTFYEMGYTEDDISIYYTRHDEVIFKVKEELVKDAWVFKQFNKIFIDDWTPSSLTFKYGYNYKVPDEELTAKVERSCQENEDRIVHYEAGTSIDTDYYPIDAVFNLYVHFIVVGSVTIVAYYDKSQNKVLYSLLQTNDKEEIIVAIKQRIRSVSARVYATGYRGICVHSNELTGEDFYAGNFIKYFQVVSVDMNDVILLCKLMTKRYCRKYGIEESIEVSFSGNEYLQKATNLELLEVSSSDS